MNWKTGSETLADGTYTTSVPLLFAFAVSLIGQTGWYSEILLYNVNELFVIAFHGSFS